MSDVTADTPEAVVTPSRLEIGLWSAAVLASGLLVPGLGMLVALVLAFTRLRHARPVVRWGLVGLGLAVLFIQIIGLLAWGGEPALDISPEQPASSLAGRR